MSDKSSSEMVKKGWHWTPTEPVKLSPLFSWPLNLPAIVKWVISSWAILTVRALILAISVMTWYLVQPALERCKTFQFDWMLEIWARNLALMVFVAGGLHLFLFTFRKQGEETKYDPRPLSEQSRTFLFRNQVYDNMFWTLVSGVTVWTVFEWVTFWGYANGYISMITFAEHPFWFVMIFFLLPIWGSLHFYWIHRLLHWPPLYRFAHELHHRNINVGPWSGMSMHPVEHVLYLSTGLVHWLIASHPVHFLFHMQLKALEASTSHSGYESLLIRDRSKLALGDFFHQMHHRYFECNYGTLEMPWDRWFGSFHDGTEVNAENIRQRRRRMHADKP
ncbi:MAG: sterol desaturase family protein [Anderseniella sp.]